MKLIAVTCDRYYDIAPAFLELLRKNWPDCPHEVVFVTNKKLLSVPSVVYLPGEDKAFGWRMRQFISHHYTDEHLLFFMADYLIKSADTLLIAAAHELCATPGIRHVRLRPMPHPPMDYSVVGFGVIDKRRRYSLSLQPGIWETQVLYDLLNDGEDPWASEINGSIRVRGVTGLFLSTKSHAISHVNYYNKGRPQGVNWVKETVSPEAWPLAARG